MATKSTGLLSSIAADFQNDVAGPLAEGAAAVEFAVILFGEPGCVQPCCDAQMIAGSVSGLLGNFGISSSGGMTMPQQQYVRSRAARR